MVLRLLWTQKQMFWAFEKGMFKFFVKFWVSKLKPFSGKAWQPSRPSKFKVGDRKLFRTWFWSNLEIKHEFSEHLKMDIFNFLQFLGDEVEAIFWESEAKHRKQLKTKFGHRNFLRKWFLTFFELKNQYCGRLKIALFKFFAIFWLTKLQPFSGKLRQNIKNCLNPNLVIESFLKNGFEATLRSKTYVLSVYFRVFCKFLSD